MDIRATSLTKTLILVSDLLKALAKANLLPKR